MIVGVSTFELHLPGSRGLKEKRKVVKGLIERIHKRYRVSIAETDFHDLHQRAEITLAMVGLSESELDQRMEDIRSLIDAVGPEAFLTRWDPQWMEARS